AARAGLRAIVLVAESAARGKLIQARALGAHVLAVRGSFDEALTAAKKLGERGDHVLVNSLNPNRVEGQKTAVFEIVEELGAPPDAFVLPYGGGGNTTAYAKALSELELATPVYSIEAADRRTTLASAIQIEQPAHRDRVGASGARVHAVPDEEIVSAWLELARDEGLFCEPSSAAGLAFLRGSDELRGARVVVTITGNGLKDPGAADSHAPAPVAVDPDPDAIARATA